METIASRRFMACPWCWCHHRIGDDGQWVWRCPEEEQAHQESVKRMEPTQCCDTH